jgi:hypothetical protein
MSDNNGTSFRVVKQDGELGIAFKATAAGELVVPAQQLKEAQRLLRDYEVLANPFVLPPQ